MKVTEETLESFGEVFLNDRVSGWCCLLEIAEIPVWVMRENLVGFDAALTIRREPQERPVRVIVVETGNQNPGKH